MNRRGVLKLFSAGAVTALVGQVAWHVRDTAEPLLYEDIVTNPQEMARSIRYMTTRTPDSGALLDMFKAHKSQAMLAEVGREERYRQKMLNFEQAHQDDVFLADNQYQFVVSAFSRLGRLQTLVGHGNFNVIGFDEMLRLSVRYPVVGEFPPAEVAFLDELFSSSAKRYGFFGEKVINELTAQIPERERVKMPGTGHFLFKGDSLQVYSKLQKDLGQSVILTSGIRSVVKQTHLFLAKTIQAKGNLSLASRSLAPPGHSFHGVGDFDVGKVGLGASNFTDVFAETAEFQQLVDLGFVSMRYPKDNQLGVRYEPWHVKVVST